VTVHRFHEIWAWCVVGLNAATGVWAVLAHWFAPFRRRGLWWSVIAAEVAIGVQVCAGVWLIAVSDFELQSFHAFYGFISLFTVALMYAYRSQVRHLLYAVYGFGGLFLMGLALRAISLKR
jgi:hypothetical protein